MTEPQAPGPQDSQDLENFYNSQTFRSSQTFHSVSNTVTSCTITTIRYEPKTENTPLVWSIIALGFLLMGLVGVGFSLHQRQVIANGEAGTFTPLEQQCHTVTRSDEDGDWQSLECGWDGRFEGAQTTVDDIHLDDDLGKQYKDPPPAPLAASLTEDGKLYRAGFFGWWKGLLFGGPFVVGSLIIFACLAIGRHRRRRRQRPTPAPPRPRRTPRA